MAVELNDVGLRRRTVMDIGDVTHEDDRAVDHFHRQIVEVRDSLGGIVEIDCEFVGPNLLCSDRIDLVLQGERLADVCGRKTVGAQRILVEVDLHRPCRPAIRIRDLSARYRYKLRPDEIQGEIGQFNLGVRVAGQSQLDHRDA